MTRRPVIGVMGGGEAASAGECAAAETFGRLVAESGWVLLCGGRAVGIMEAAARGANEAGGFVVGILPGRDDDPAVVSAHLDLVILTGMGDARNAVNVLSSHVVVACPGGPGTVSEVALALKSGRPVVLLGWDAPTQVFPTYLASGALRIVATPDAARDMVATLLAEAQR
jgi:uncharacterized protein (TIGR00725 family)